MPAEPPRNYGPRRDYGSDAEPNWDGGYNDDAEDDEDEDELPKLPTNSTGRDNLSLLVGRKKNVSPCSESWNHRRCRRVASVKARR